MLAVGLSLVFYIRNNEVYFSYLLYLSFFLFYFIFWMFPLRVATADLLPPPLTSSSVTPTICISSFTACMNLLVFLFSSHLAAPHSASAVHWIPTQPCLSNFVSKALELNCPSGPSQQKSYLPDLYQYSSLCALPSMRTFVPQYCID